MRYYAYSPTTGEFLDSRDAQVDPVTSKKKGTTVYLLPGACETPEPVPAQPDGHVAVWTGSSWVSTPDHRGETWYDSEGNPVEIRNLGAPTLQRTPPSRPMAREDFGIAIKGYTDAVAAQRGYSDGANAASYAGSTVARFSAEANAFIAWRDAVWLKVEEIEAAVLSGQRVMPRAVEDVVAEFPVIEWPGSPEA